MREREEGDFERGEERRVFMGCEVGGEGGKRTYDEAVMKKSEGRKEGRGERQGKRSIRGVRKSEGRLRKL